MRHNLSIFNISNYNERVQLCKICEMNYNKIKINFSNDDNYISIYLFFDYPINEETYYLYNKTEEIEKITKYSYTVDYSSSDYLTNKETYYSLNKIEETENINKYSYTSDYSSLDYPTNKVTYYLSYNTEEIENFTKYSNTFYDLSSDYTRDKETYYLYNKLEEIEIITKYSYNPYYLSSDYITNKESYYPLNETKKIEKIMESLINLENRTDIDNGIDKEIKEDNILITFTTTTNQKNNVNINKTTIDLGECENLLKINYNISLNSSLYIIKMDIKEEGMKIPKIEYEVYYPLYNDELIKLDLIVCKNTKITTSIPVSINDDINKYNPNSDYFNDICSKSTSKNGTDIPLADRKNEFINENMSLCEEDCDLEDYDYENKIAKCSCLTKINIPLIEDIKFDKNKLLKRFTDIKSIVNLNIMKCYKIVFDKKNINKNYGFFIVLSIELLYYICLFLFIIQGFNQLKLVIKHIIFMLKTRKKNRKSRQNNFKQKLIKLDTINVKQLNTIYGEYAMNRFESDSNNKSEKSNTMVIDTGIEIDNLGIILEYKEFELNALDYEEALTFDKRTFIQCYFGLLRINHLFMFSFINSYDYNSKIIKIFLFFFFFTINLTVTALFFNDDTMHQIYIDEGSYNIVYRLPIIIYSSIISLIISTLIKFLCLSQDKIVKIKREKTKRDLDEKYRKLISTLKIKFKIFFIITFIILLFSWYYLSCFCGIYVNTQSHLIKDTAISFITSMIYPFGIYLIPGMFRIYSLRHKKSCLYKFSKLLQLI